MAAACRGERPAFAQLVDRHQAELYTLFRRLGADGHSAEDCVQDTFLRLLRAHAAWTPRAPFRSFLQVLARNAFIDQCRRRRARPTQPLPPGESAGAEDEEGPGFEREPRDGSRWADAGVPGRFAQAGAGTRAGDGLPFTETLRLPGDHAPQDVRAALDALPEKQRLVVQLNMWQGLRYQEIAQVLEIPEGTVKSRMFHALARLREALQRDHVA